MTVSNSAPNSSSQITGCTSVTAIHQGWRSSARTWRYVMAHVLESGGRHGSAGPRGASASPPASSGRLGLGSAARTCGRRSAGRRRRATAARPSPTRPRPPASSACSTAGTARRRRRRGRAACAPSTRPRGRLDARERRPHDGRSPPARVELDVDRVAAQLALQLPRACPRRRRGRGRRSPAAPASWSASSR